MLCPFLCLAWFQMRNSISFKSVFAFRLCFTSLWLFSSFFAFTHHKLNHDVFWHRLFWVQFTILFVSLVFPNLGNFKPYLLEYSFRPLSFSSILEFWWNKCLIFLKFDQKVPEALFLFYLPSFLYFFYFLLLVEIG